MRCAYHSRLRPTDFRTRAITGPLYRRAHDKEGDAFKFSQSELMTLASTGSRSRKTLLSSLRSSLKRMENTSCSRT